MKSQAFEILLKDLLRITVRETRTLQEVLAENFNSLDTPILKVLREEYQKPKNDWRIMSGCFSVISKFSEKYPKIAGSVLRNNYPLLNKGLLDKRISIRRLATLAILNIICMIYIEERMLSIGGDKDNEINAEVRELKKSIDSAIFLESFNSLFPTQLEKRLACETAGIKVEVLTEVTKFTLG